MVIACPNCATSFRLDPAQLGTEGRMVRCSACRHTWFQPPPRPEPQDAPPVPPDFRAMEDEAPRRRQRAPAPRESRGGGGITIIAIMIIVLLLIAIGAAGVIMRDQVLAEFPQLAPVYEAVGLVPAPPPAPGAGLAVRNEALNRVDVEGRSVLVLTGEVANLSQTARPMPLLKAVLLDAAEGELTAVTFEADAREVAVGGSVPFTTRIENPPLEATNLRVLFVARPAAAD